MRIAVVVDRFPVLSETFVVRHVTGLIDRGLDVHVLARRNGEPWADQDDALRYGLEQRTSFLCPGRDGPRPTSGARWLARHMIVRPSAVLRWLVPLRPRLTPQKAATRLITEPSPARDNYDIIHAHFGPNGAAAAFWRDIGVLSGRLVTTFHGYDLSTNTAFRSRALLQHLFARGDLFLPVSDRWKRRLVDLGCPTDRIVVHRMGIDTRVLPFRAPGSRRHGALRLVSVGRLVEKKGFEYGLNAVARLNEAGWQVEYSIIGDGPLRPRLAALATRLELDNVTFLGARRWSEVVRILRNSDLLVAPSVTAADGDQEGIPVVIMEAMALGVPVISTAHSGIPELVEDGVSGLLVPERDVAALMKAVSRLAGSPTLQADMARRARQKVEREYDLDVLHDRLVDMYRALVPLERLAEPGHT